jgi:hypothetical protein
MTAKPHRLIHVNWRDRQQSRPNGAEHSIRHGSIAPNKKCMPLSWVTPHHIIAAHSAASKTNTDPDANGSADRVGGFG